MKLSTLGALVALAALAASPLAVNLVTASPQVGVPTGQIMQSHDMVGNIDGPASPTVAGVNPAPFAWVVGKAEVGLNGNGQLNVKVQGLLFADGRPIPSGFMVEATLACQTTSTTWAYATSSPVPLSSSGDAQIHQALTLPSSPCYAPIVLVTSATGLWFAVTGY